MVCGCPGDYVDLGSPELRPHTEGAKMSSTIYFILRTVGLGLVVGLIWRISSQRHALPCPTWLEWMVELDIPFTKVNRARFKGFLDRKWLMESIYRNHLRLITIIMRHTKSNISRLIAQNRLVICPTIKMGIVARM